NPKRSLHTNTSSMGVLVEGGAAGGKRFGAQVTTCKDTDRVKQEIPFNPTKEQHAFKIEYDPKANKNIGRLTVTLDNATTSIDLTEQQRAEGINFDRFGVANLRCGGKYVVVYLDDLTYTARRSADYKPTFHKQEVTYTEYPEGGRKY